MKFNDLNKTDILNIFVQNEIESEFISTEPDSNKTNNIHNGVITLKVSDTPLYHTMDMELINGIPTEIKGSEKPVYAEKEILSIYINTKDVIYGIHSEQFELSDNKIDINECELKNETGFIPVDLPTPMLDLFYQKFGLKEVALELGYSLSYYEFRNEFTPYKIINTNSNSTQVFDDEVVSDFSFKTLEELVSKMNEIIKD